MYQLTLNPDNTIDAIQDLSECEAVMVNEGDNNIQVTNAVFKKIDAHLQNGVPGHAISVIDGKVAVVASKVDVDIFGDSMPSLEERLDVLESGTPEERAAMRDRVKRARGAKGGVL